MFSAGLQAATDEQISAIEELGRLNGIALQCKYLDQTRNIKRALVAALPKQRSLGHIFENATNSSFLVFIESSADCPGVDNLMDRVDTGIRTLYNVFAD